MYEKQNVVHSLEIIGAYTIERKHMHQKPKLVYVPRKRKLVHVPTKAATCTKSHKLLRTRKTSYVLEKKVRTKKELVRTKTRSCYVPKTESLYMYRRYLVLVPETVNRTCTKS